MSILTRQLTPAWASMGHDPVKALASIRAAGGLALLGLPNDASTDAIFRAAALTPGGRQIGRASWRERV